MAASFVTSSLHLGHIATAMLPLCNNELTERCCHFGLTFVMKRPLKRPTTIKERPEASRFIVVETYKINNANQAPA